jgi:nucleotide-binding universal stress UspA family protein
MNVPTAKIVCATDFSENAKGAADVAAAIALKLDTELVLIHVADQARAYTEGTRALQAFLRPIADQLAKEAVRLRRTTVTVKEVLLYGKWAEIALVEYVQSAPPALMVVSSVSKTAFDRWTIGSVSEKIAQYSPAPTLVVRAPQRLLEWIKEQHPLKVTVAADFTVSSDAAIAWVRQLKKVGPCAVTLAHINWPPDEHRPTQLKLSGRTTNLPSVRRQVRRDLRHSAADLLEGEVEVRVQSNWGRPDAALVQLARDADADVIVMGTHQWHGFKRVAHVSISRGVLRHAQTNVVCVPVTVALAHGLAHRRDISRVLVATDFSETGDQAVPWAYAALPASGMVKMIHVLAPDDGSTSSIHSRIVAAREKLNALVPRDAGAARAETEVEVLIAADPAEAISEAVRSFDPDVICLGTKGHGPIAKAVLGSVTRAVMKKNHQPVLLVRPPPA